MNGEADAPWPDWLDDLVETAADAIQLKGFGEVECRYRAPDDNSWGTHLPMFAPDCRSSRRAVRTMGSACGALSTWSSCCLCSKSSMR